MDAPTEALSAYAASLTYDELPQSAVRGMKRCLLDSLACAAGGFSGPPSRIAQAWASGVTATAPATILFTGAATTPEAAAYANGVMVRYLDCNDTYRAMEGGHPSDAISAVLAAAEAVGADGRTTLLGLVTAYEVFCALSEMEALGPKGIDHCLHVSAAAALGAGKVMGLGQGCMAHALSLALVPNVTLRVAREGRLSMWKGAAAPNAARNGLFAAQMAALDLKGPEAPFLGPNGLAKLLGAEPVLPPLGGRGQPFHTDRTNMKFFPAEYHAQAPIWAALTLRERLGADEIERLSVHTYAFAYHEIGSGEAKWQVTDRETADHSLPYLVAVSLLDGELGPDQFTEERITEAGVQRLVSRITVHEDPALTADYPATIATRLEATTTGGRSEVVALEHPKGHVQNPLSDDELRLKFQRFADPLLSRETQHEALEWLASLEEAPDIRPVLASMRSPLAPMRGQ